ncbi:hypothetical protein [Roseomonas sp. 18066]|uniref:hypothetical protein n=1 Tax=Roseomonas sp. 18066 TaxID=2681412 RepID=UPI00135A0894|nr:hypothetical protein [Roseomonas sp. 18066]
MPALRAATLAALLSALAACAGVSTRSMDEAGPAIEAEAADPAGRPHRSPRSIEEGLHFRF